MPDGVIGAVGKTAGDEEDETAREEVWFLTRGDDGFAVLDGEKTVIAEYGADQTAAAFSDGKSFYIIRKNGSVLQCTPDGGEENFADLGVTLGEVRSPFIWDGQIYWLDGEGLKTVDKK